MYFVETTKQYLGKLMIHVCLLLLQNKSFCQEIDSFITIKYMRP